MDYAAGNDSSRDFTIPQSSSIRKEYLIDDTKEFSASNCKIRAEGEAAKAAAQQHASA